MTFTISTGISITLVALGFMCFILYLMNKDQAKTIKGLELQVSQYKQQNERLIESQIEKTKRIGEFAKGYEDMEDNYNNALVALNVCEVKLNDR
jgi:hypothetical protein